MVGAGRVQLNRKFRAASARELFGMQAQPQSAGSRRSKNFTRLCDGESAVVAINIAEFSEMFRGDPRNPLAADQIGISVGRLAGAMAKFGRDNMCAQKCAHDVEGLLALEFAENQKNLALAFPSEAVSGFCFERCGAMRGELNEMRARAGFQIGGRRAAEFADAVDDAAAGASDFFVGGARDAVFVLGCTGAGVDEMRMRINEAGEDHAATQIEFARMTRLAEVFH